MTQQIENDFGDVLRRELPGIRLAGCVVVEVRGHRPRHYDAHANPVVADFLHDRLAERDEPGLRRAVGGATRKVVLGGQARNVDDPSTAGPAELARLKGDILKLYHDDAIAAWEGVLRDVTLSPLGSLEQAVERTKALSGPSSPLKLLVQAIVTETRLTVPPPVAEEEGGGNGPEPRVATRVAKAAAKVALGKLGGKITRFSPMVTPEDEGLRADIEAALG